MLPDQLRSLQAPLKERYRADPSSAMLTMSAVGRLGENVTCVVQPGAGGGAGMGTGLDSHERAPIVAGLHPFAGGDGSAACSGDMFLEALVGCAGVTLNAVATAMGIVIRKGTLTAEGDLDFRGTLGVDKSTPVGFQRIRLKVALDTDASDEQIGKLLTLMERYCVVFQTLARPPEMAVERV